MKDDVVDSLNAMNTIDGKIKMHLLGYL